MRTVGVESQHRLILSCFSDRKLRLVAVAVCVGCAYNGAQWKGFKATDSGKHIGNPLGFDFQFLFISNVTEDAAAALLKDRTITFDAVGRRNQHFLNFTDTIIFRGFDDASGNLVSDSGVGNKHYHVIITAQAATLCGDGSNRKGNQIVFLHNKTPLFDTAICAGCVDFS